MASDAKREPDLTSGEAVPFRRLVLDEAIGVWVGSCGPDDVDAALTACSRLGGASTLVLWLPRALAPEHVCRALGRAATVAETLVLIANDRDRYRWGALGDSDVRAVARRGGRENGRVLIEPDPRRAVVGAMQWLGPGDSLYILWPDEPDCLALDGLIALGAAWRGAWDEPENGEFHNAPRGLGKLLEHPLEAIEDYRKRGEDR